MKNDKLRMDKIEQTLTYQERILNKSRSPYYSTYIDGIVYNPHNDKKTETTKKFIFDTGAAITILNRQLSFLFDEDTPIVDHVKIKYGNGIPRDLPVYNVNIKIKGIDFPTLAAFDENMTLPSLLGHYAFLNNLEHYSVSKKKNKLTIIK